MEDWSPKVSYLYVCMCACMCVRMYVCMYVYVCIGVYVYVCEQYHCVLLGILYNITLSRRTMTDDPLVDTPFQLISGFFHVNQGVLCC